MRLLAYEIKISSRATHTSMRLFYVFQISVMCSSGLPEHFASMCTHAIADSNFFLTLPPSVREEMFGINLFGLTNSPICVFVFCRIQADCQALALPPASRLHHASGAGDSAPARLAPDLI